MKLAAHIFLILIFCAGGINTSCGQINFTQDDFNTVSDEQDTTAISIADSGILDTESINEPHTGDDCVGGKYDANTGLCWQVPKTAELFTFDAAFQYCQSLTLGGHTDWRLPSKEEFILLLDNCDSAVYSGEHGHCDSCADSTSCSKLFGPDIFWYWTNTAKEGSGWCVSFFVSQIHNHSFIGQDQFHINHHVRCVR